MNVMDLLRLDGRVAIVTGGRGLYGSAISEGLCEAGATVVIASRNGARCEEYAETLREKGYRACGKSLDLGSDASINALVDEVLAEYGRIDVLVNNAVSRENLDCLDAITRDMLNASSDVNLSGTIMLSQRVVAEMKKAGKGSVVNISSMRGIDCPHFPYYRDGMFTPEVNYTTEKWAMEGLTKYMAGCYGRDGIRVNSIAPGGYNGENPQGAVGEEGAFSKLYRANCPLGDWAHYDDIKGPVVFLASDASAYVTGDTLVMDGGWTIW